LTNTSNILDNIEIVCILCELAPYNILYIKMPQDVWVRYSVSLVWAMMHFSPGISKG
jgi:hypothetical protein